jgi:hypothetical protein
MVGRLYSLPEHHQHRHQYDHHLERHSDNAAAGNLGLECHHLWPHRQCLHADSRKLDSQDRSKGIRSNRIHLQRSTSGDSEIRVQWIDGSPQWNTILISYSDSFSHSHAKTFGHSYANAFSYSYANPGPKPHGYPDTGSLPNGNAKAIGYPYSNAYTDSDCNAYAHPGP